MPEKMVVEATVPERKDASGKIVQQKVGPYTLSVETGVTAEESIKMFGPDPVKTNSDANWRVVLQGNMRGGMKKGESQAQLQARLGAAKMGVAAKGIKVDPIEAYAAMFMAGTPAEQKKMMEDLMKRAATK